MSEEFNVSPMGVAAPAKASSLLEQFKADMAEELPDVDVVIPHKYRKGYAMRFHTDLPTRQLTQFQKQCVTNTRKGEIDSLRLSCIIVGALNVGITRDGEDLRDPAGQPVTFGSRFLWDALEVEDSQAAIRKFLARDGFVMAVAEEMLRQCGYDDEVAPDPTNAS